MPAETEPIFNFKSSNPFNLLRDFLESTHDKHKFSLDQHQWKGKLFRTWATIVEAYSQARLTKERDKLIALSAIAREMQPLMQCRYLAGHWERDLIRQLGWEGDPVGHRSRTYCAPSWSWASVSGQNDYFHQMYGFTDQYYYYPMIEIKDVGIELAGDDPMGPVKGGHLTICGQLYDVELQEEEEVSRPLKISGRGTVLSFHIDGFDTKFVEGPLYCMILFVGFDGHEINVRGLMLQPSGPPNNYQRVGCIKPNIQDRLSKEDPILELLGKIERNDNGIHKFQKHETGQQTFTIV